MKVQISRIDFWIIFPRETPEDVCYLDVDGLWKQETRPELRVPFLSVEGPNIEAIAGYVQGLRDNFKWDRPHYIKLRRCRWMSETELKIALTAHEGYQRGLPALAQVLLQYHEERGTAAGWQSEREILKAASDAAASDNDKLFVRDVAEAIRLVEAEE